MQCLAMEEINDFKDIYFFHTLSSTNIHAQEQIKAKKITENSVVVAKKQDAGKGQRGTQWLSNHGENLLFSIVYFPKSLDVSAAFYLSKVTSLALFDLVTELTEGQIKIKWPNDIYVGSKKIAGILIENNILGSAVSSSVIGIGLNVNQALFEKQLNATSIMNESGQKHQLTSLLSKFLQIFNKWLFTQSKEQVDSAYLQALYGHGQTMNFEDKLGLFQGVILGVAENGLLHVKKENGNTCFYEIKEIRFTG